ncbi:hypothetical protein AX15_005209, partial [Amanita polypyramis BW_CC]
MPSPISHHPYDSSLPPDYNSTWLLADLIDSSLEFHPLFQEHTDTLPWLYPTDLFTSGRDEHNELDAHGVIDSTSADRIYWSVYDKVNAFR